MNLEEASSSNLEPPVEKQQKTLEERASARLKTMPLDHVSCLLTPPTGDLKISVTTGGYGGQNYDSFDRNIARTFCQNKVAKANWNVGCEKFDESKLKTCPVFVDSFCVYAGNPIRVVDREPFGPTFTRRSLERRR